MGGWSGVTIGMAIPMATVVALPVLVVNNAVKRNRIDNMIKARSTVLPAAIAENESLTLHAFFPLCSFAESH